MGSCRWFATVDLVQKGGGKTCKMAAIGFGRTRNELLDTVKKTLERNQRPNPFNMATSSLGIPATKY
jgi:hypothetical protein